MNVEKIKKNEEFFIGTATSATLIEGETINEWAGVKVKNSSVVDDGPKHWRKYRYDFKIMAKLGIKNYIFGCDWGRLQRKPYDKLEKEAAYRYLEMMAELRSYKIEPWVVLFDHALPKWCAKKGGWLNEETPKQFADFAEKLTQVTDCEINNFITIAQPKNYALNAYVWGNILPYRYAKIVQANKVIKNMQIAHKMAKEKIKNIQKNAQVNIIIDSIFYRPKRKWNPIDKITAWIANKIINNAKYENFLENTDKVIINNKGAKNITWKNFASMATIINKELLDNNKKNYTSYQLPKIIQNAKNKKYFIYELPNEKNHKQNYMQYFKKNINHAKEKLKARGCFFKPFIDSFDWKNGLEIANGLLQVNSQDQERRREIKPIAKNLANTIKEINTNKN